MEAYGTGLKRIFKEYKNYQRQPRLSVTPNTFTISISSKQVDKNASSKIQLTPAQKKVLDLIQTNGSATDQMIMDSLHIKSSRTMQLTRELRNLGLISTSDRGENKTHRIAAGS